MDKYDDHGMTYWRCICPFCGEREAVLFRDGLLRSCRFCGAQWDEYVTTGRFVESKCDMSMKESPIMGVTYIPWKFAASASVAEKQEVLKEEKKMSESKALQVFSFEGKETRVVDVNGEPWFVAKDICEILGIVNSSDAISSLLDNEKGVATTDTIGGKQSVSIISESGMYKMIFKSRKPEAEKFTTWVTSEVLPAIRKHGAYMTPHKLEEAILNPDTIIQLATRMKEERAKRLELESLIEIDRPKVLFANSVSASSNSILIGELDKLLKQNGVDIGQNRLFAKLRDEGYLMKEDESRNMPTQRSMDMGLFFIKETTINNPDGSIRVTKTTKVTGKGQVYFVNKFLASERKTA